MPKVTLVKQGFPKIQRKKKVAAYARVSRDSERLLHSLSAQVSYYSGLIQANPEWEYAGVYADEAVTGTLVRKREQFQKMVEDAEAGKVDIILTKSIQRFARNTVDLLETVRHLKDIGVEVRFEEQNISTMSGDGELMLTILASFAQEEVRSLSENVRWAKRKKMMEGRMPSRIGILGYSWEGEELVINPEGAEVVRRIFNLYMEGNSPGQICRRLNEEGDTSVLGNAFKEQSIYYILRNPLYKGDLILQKTFTADPIAKVKKKNEGELEQYLVEEDHPPIIPPEMFRAVQEEMGRRKQAWLEYDFEFEGMRPLTRLLTCGLCGQTLHHSPIITGYGCDGSWYCDTKGCNNGGIPDLAARQACNRALHTERFDADLVREQVERITVTGPGRFDVVLKDGTVYQDVWHMLGVSTAGMGRNGPSFKGRLNCGICGETYQRHMRMRKGIRLVYWNCRCGKNSYIHENILQRRICEVLGMGEFSFQEFEDRVDRIVMDRPCHMEVHLRDGSLRYAEYYASERKQGKYGKKGDKDSSDKGKVSEVGRSDREEAAGCRICEGVLGS